MLFLSPSMAFFVLVALWAGTVTPSAAVSLSISGGWPFKPLANGEPQQSSLVPLLMAIAGGKNETGGRVEQNETGTTELGLAEGPGESNADTLATIPPEANGKGERGEETGGAGTLPTTDATGASNESTTSGTAGRGRRIGVDSLQQQLTRINNAREIFSPREAHERRYKAYEILMQKINEEEKRKRGRNGTAAKNGTTVDPWLDDVVSLGMTDGGRATETEAQRRTTAHQQGEGKEQEGQGKGKESFEDRRARLCSDALSKFTSDILKWSPPFFCQYFGCHYKGSGQENGLPKKKKHLIDMEPQELESKFGNQSAICSAGIENVASTRPDCHLLYGFVDHLLTFPNETLVATLSGQQLKGHSAVVRLVCEGQMEKLMEALNAELRSTGKKKQKEELSKKQSMQRKLDSEERFLKTVFVLQFTWIPDCIVVFFDSSTLDRARDAMAGILLRGPKLNFGTRDGQNKWAATKFVCGHFNRNAFDNELARLRWRTREVPKGLSERDNQVRKVLADKIDEEMFPAGKEVTAGPPSGFLQRLWDGLFG